MKRIGRLKLIYQYYNRFVITLVLLNIYLFVGVFEPYLGIPQIVKYILSIIIIYNIIYFYTSSPKRIKSGKLVEFFRNIFLVVSIFLLVSGVRLEGFFLQELFGARYFFMPYLIPLFFLFIRYNLTFFEVIFKYTYILLLLGIFVEFFILVLYRDETFYGRGLTAIYTFSLAPALLLFVSHLFKNKNIARFTTVYFILATIITAIWGRRGETIESVFTLVFAFVLRIQSNTVVSTKKAVFFIGAVSFFMISFFLIDANKDKIYLFDRGLSAEGFETSRGETIDNFLYDFGRRPLDYLIGRGLNGTFQKFDTGERANLGSISNSIEIGYFNVLLKGGFLYLIPMIFLLTIAFINGYFRSSNDLVKGLSVIVLWQIIIMVSFGMADFSPRYILIWIAVAACLDPGLRAVTNNELKKLLNFGVAIN